MPVIDEAQKSDNLKLPNSNHKRLSLIIGALRVLIYGIPSISFRSTISLVFNTLKMSETER